MAQMVAFNQLYKEFDEIYHRYAKACGMSDSAFWVLYCVLEREEPYTQKELCDTWSYSRQTVNSALKSLERQGIVRLVPEPHDRKSKRIVLTPRGEALAKEKAAPLFAAEREAFGELRVRERGEFLRLMEKHVRLLQARTDVLLRSWEERAGE